ncbi:MAG: hypothetical protein KDI65_02785 [Alphaproteobacteria bacterium]|nr:hypothetical protein [Alphaproteobacteria bacterium]
MSGDRRDDDAGAIAWPGFVDILSSVMIMFLFFMLITSIVMFALNIEYRKKLKEESEKKFAEIVSTELKDKLSELLSGNITVDQLKDKLEYESIVDDLSNKTETLQHQNTALNIQIDELEKVLEQVRSDTVQGTEQRTNVSKDNNLVIMFNNNDITLSKETIAVVEAYMQAVLKHSDGKKLTFRLLTSDNPNAQTISVSREVSLARSLNVRNVLIRGSIPTEQVNIEYSKPESIDDSYNWLKIVVEIDDS